MKQGEGNSFSSRRQEVQARRCTVGSSLPPGHPPTPCKAGFAFPKVINARAFGRIARLGSERDIRRKEE